MGQKIHPIGFRIGVNRDSDSKWYADKQYADFVYEDFKIRKMAKKRKGWDNAAIAKIEIERQANQVKVTLHTAKPGIIIGRGGAGVDMLKADLEKLTKKTVHVNVQEIRHLETNAQLVAESIAQQIEKRIGYKRAMRQAVTRAMKLGVRGIRCHVAGRLGGSEMARQEQDRQGKIPLHTLRADIDYGFDEALTQYGHIGVKVWIYKGDILPYKITTDDKATREAAMATGETMGAARPRKVVSAGGARRLSDTAAEAQTVDAPADGDAEPIIKEADPELERLLAEEEEIERLTKAQEHHETPHFRPGEGD